MRHRVLVALAVILSCVLAVSVQAQRIRSAESEVTGAEVRLASLIEDARVVLRHRAADPTAAEQERPTSDVIALVNRTLTAAGLPTSRFSGCAPEGDVAVPGSDRLRRQSVRLQLEPLTVPELGAFLSSLRDETSLWSESSIELSHRSGPDDAFSVAIVLTAHYHAATEPRTP